MNSLLLPAQATERTAEARRALTALRLASLCQVLSGDDQFAFFQVTFSYFDIHSVRDSELDLHGLRLVIGAWLPDDARLALQDGGSRWRDPPGASRSDGVARAKLSCALGGAKRSAALGIFNPSSLSAMTAVRLVVIPGLSLRSGFATSITTLYVVRSYT